jgi:uncharacterized protein YcfJ
MGYLSANLQGKMEAVTNLSLNPFEASSLERQKPQFTFEDIQSKKPGMAGKLMQMTRNATFSMSAAGTIGGVAGAAIGSLFGGVGAIPGQIIGAAVGGTIAGIVGLVAGAKEGLENVQEKNKHTVSLVIKQFIDDSQTHCSRVLSKAIKELEIYIRDDLTAQIKREKQTCDRTLRSLQDARKLAKSTHAGSNCRVDQGWEVYHDECFVGRNRSSYWHSRSHYSLSFWTPSVFN